VDEKLESGTMCDPYKQTRVFRVLFFVHIIGFFCQSEKGNTYGNPLTMHSHATQVILSFSHSPSLSDVLSSVALTVENRMVKVPVLFYNTRKEDDQWQDESMQRLPNQMNLAFCL
jgi:hypothetical protein